MKENKELMLKYFKYTLKEFLKLEKEGVFLCSIEDCYRKSIKNKELKIKKTKTEEKKYFIYNSFDLGFIFECCIFYPSFFNQGFQLYKKSFFLIDYIDIEHFVKLDYIKDNILNINKENYKEFINIYDILNYNENNYNDKINKAMFIGFLKLVIYLNKNNKMEYLL